MIFSVGAGGKPEAKFDRDINTAWEAVEELRYRYTGRHGREPWLEVLDKFIQLVGERNPVRLVHIIDRVNNLQHSNGLFMEHFPSAVKRWYLPFLNAKYHAPTAEELAKFIPDRDLRDLVMGVTRRSGVARPGGWDQWRFEPPPAYHQMVKVLQDVGEKINWRERGYPRIKGLAQVDRFDPRVQEGLDTLKELHKQRERILSTQIESQPQYEQWVDQVRDWAKDYDQALDRAKDALEQYALDEEARAEAAGERPWWETIPEGTAEAWEAAHFPEEFLRRFPWSVPGVSKSDLAPFLARYAREAVRPDRQPEPWRVVARYWMARA